MLLLNLTQWSVLQVLVSNYCFTRPKIHTSFYSDGSSILHYIGSPLVCFTGSINNLRPFLKYYVLPASFSSEFCSLFQRPRTCPIRGIRRSLQACEGSFCGKAQQLCFITSFLCWSLQLIGSNPRRLRSQFGIHRNSFACVTLQTYNWMSRILDLDFWIILLWCDFDTHFPTTFYHIHWLFKHAFWTAMMESSLSLTSCHVCMSFCSFFLSLINILSI